MPARKTVKRKVIDLSHPKATDKRKRVYSLQDLPFKGKTLASLFSELDKNADEIDALKRPEERWALQIEGKNTYIVKRSMRDIAGGIHDSGSLRDLTPQAQKRIIKNIKILKTNKSVTEINKSLIKQRKTNAKKYQTIETKKVKAEAKKKMESREASIRERAKKSREKLRLREKEKHEKEINKIKATHARQIARLKEAAKPKRRKL
jgi:hypothetical protein